jgi:hypothetical protein
MARSSLDLLRSSLEALRNLEAVARERGNLERAEIYAGIARRYEAEIRRLEDAAAGICEEDEGVGGSEER